MKRISSAAPRLVPVGALAAVLLMSGTAIASPTCTIRGSHRGETLTGSPGRDVICGRGGNDTLRGLGGDDILLGGAGDDVLDGGAGADVFRAGAGDDVVRARDGRRDCADPLRPRPGHRVGRRARPAGRPLREADEAGRGGPVARAHRQRPARSPRGRPWSTASRAANAGPDAATGITVATTLPAGATAEPSSGCSTAGAVVTCSLADVPAGGSAGGAIAVRHGSPGTKTVTSAVALADAGRQRRRTTPRPRRPRSSRGSPRRRRVSVSVSDSPDPVSVLAERRLHGAGGNAGHWRPTPSRWSWTSTSRGPRSRGPSAARQRLFPTHHGRPATSARSPRATSVVQGPRRRAGARPAIRPSGRPSTGDRPGRPRPPPTTPRRETHDGLS